jgi:hypothetical protein
MPWKLTENEKVKLQKEVDDNLAGILEKCIEDEEVAKKLGITKEQALEQLKNRPKK